MLRRAALTNKIYFHIHGMNHSLGFILPFIHTLYKVSHLTWNTSQQHAAAAASELPGNDLVTTHNIAAAC
jgi:hypothetical protein